MQETDSDNNYEITDFVKNSDRRVKQLKFIIIIFDHKRIKADERLREYIKAFIERLN